MKLFAVYLGGKAPGANVEVHDVVFVIGKDIKSTFSDLKAKWFGNPNSVHVDSYIELGEIGKYKVSVSSKESLSPFNLYFLNIGYYQNNIFGEQHNFHFIISKSISDAKQDAKQLFSKTPISPHVDNLIDIDSLIKVKKVDDYYINIVEKSTSSEIIVNNVYWPLK